MRYKKIFLFIKLYLLLFKGRKQLPIGLFSDFDDVLDSKGPEALFDHYFMALAEIDFFVNRLTRQKKVVQQGRILIPSKRIILPGNKMNEGPTGVIHMEDSKGILVGGVFEDCKRIATMINSDATFIDSTYFGTSRDFTIEEAFNMSGKSKLHIEDNDFHSDINTFVRANDTVDITIKKNTFRGEIERFVELTNDEREITDAIAMTPVEMRDEMCKTLNGQPKDRWIDKINELSILKYIEAGEKITNASQKIYSLWEKIHPLVSGNVEFVKNFLS